MSLFVAVSGQFQEGHLRRLMSKENECLCPGDVISYECTVVGNSAVNVVWKGSALMCSSTNNEIILPLHDRNNTSLIGRRGYYKTCNNGTISGKIIAAHENGTYTSQLLVYSTESTPGTIIGKSIECAYDDGATETTVGSLNISDTNGEFKVNRQISFGY